MIQVDNRRGLRNRVMFIAGMNDAGVLPTTLLVVQSVTVADWLFSDVVRRVSSARYALPQEAIRRNR